MGRLESIRRTARWADIVQGQLLHAALIVLMTGGALALLLPDGGGPRFLGLGAAGWARLSIWLAVAHQVIVAFVFRMELYRGMMSRLFGPAAMKVWAAIFMPFLIARPLSVLAVGWLDTHPIGLWRPGELIVGLGLIAVAAVTMHSVVKHFTIRRALGADHFDEAVIALPLVRKGMFRFTDNAMYGLVFLGLWGLALAFGSWNALVVALFQHAYIWVHMYLTEAPDMRRIYGDG